MNVDALIRSVAKKFSKASVSLLSYQDSDSNTQLVSSSNPLPVNATVSGGLTIDELTALYTVMTLKVNDADNEALLTSILNKLISNPATETTSAAILAKLISNPATETTLNSLLGYFSTAKTPHFSLVTVPVTPTQSFTLTNGRAGLKGMVIMNLTTGGVGIKYGTNATTTTVNYTISANERFVVPDSILYEGRIDAYCGVGAGNIYLTEMT